LIFFWDFGLDYNAALHRPINAKRRAFTVTRGRKILPLFQIDYITRIFEGQQAAVKCKETVTVLQY
jgi:hypothetical protein